MIRGRNDFKFIICFTDAPRREIYIIISRYMYDLLPLPGKRNVWGGALLQNTWDTQLLFPAR